MTTKLILSTSNIISGGPAILQKSSHAKSNSEFIDSLRANIADAQEDAAAESGSPQPPAESLSALSRKGAVNGDSNGYQNGYLEHSVGAFQPPATTWTSRKDGRLFVPSLDLHQCQLSEPSSAYDITIKLFYLPGLSPSQRGKPTIEALNLVLAELGVTSVDLLIVSFPSILYHETISVPKVDCYGLHVVNGKAGSDPFPESDDDIRTAWTLVESLHLSGKVRKIGVSEFSLARLQKLAATARIKPSVNQVNLDDCCELPTDLHNFANNQDIELLSHNDCPDPLPEETVRDLLGQGEDGAGLLGSLDNNNDHQPRLSPKWVIKYTAVVKNRGVVENKGYFAAVDVDAEL